MKTIEDDLMWYCVDMFGIDFWRKQNIHFKINFKATYYR